VGASAIRRGYWFPSIGPVRPRDGTFPASTGPVGGAGSLGAYSKIPVLVIVEEREASWHGNLDRMLRMIDMAAIQRIPPNTMALVCVG
jgi:hypothetical protein